MAKHKSMPQAKSVKPAGQPKNLRVPKPSGAGPAGSAGYFDNRHPDPQLLRNK